MLVKDVFKALADGKKVRKKSWSPQSFICLKGGILANQHGFPERTDFSDYLYELYDDASPEQKEIEKLMADVNALETKIWGLKFEYLRSLYVRR